MSELVSRWGFRCVEDVVLRGYEGDVHEIFKTKLRGTAQWRQSMKPANRIYRIQPSIKILDKAYMWTGPVAIWPRLRLLTPSRVLGVTKQTIRLSDQKSNSHLTLTLSLLELTNREPGWTKTSNYYSCHIPLVGRWYSFQVVTPFAWQRNVGIDDTKAMCGKNRMDLRVIRG